MADPSGSVGFEEPDPQARLRAVQAAAEANDRTAVRSLIEMLDSDDPAERFFAIGTLSELAGGETFGYRHYQERSERRGSITRWVEWERTGTEHGSPADSNRDEAGIGSPSDKP